MKSLYFLLAASTVCFFGCDRPDNTEPPKADAHYNYLAQYMPQDQDQMAAQGMQRMNLGRTDEDLRIISEIRDTLYNMRGISTDTNRIQVIVNSGTVTLRGQVNSQIDKSQIERGVRSVNGVRQVNSQLTVAR